MLRNYWMMSRTKIEWQSTLAGALTINNHTVVRKVVHTLEIKIKKGTYFLEIVCFDLCILTLETMVANDAFAAYS